MLNGDIISGKHRVHDVTVGVHFDFSRELIKLVSDRDRDEN